MLISLRRVDIFIQKKLSSIQQKCKQFDENPPIIDKKAIVRPFQKRFMLLEIENYELKYRKCFIFTLENQSINNMPNKNILKMFVLIFDFENF